MVATMPSFFKVKGTKSGQEHYIISLKKKENQSNGNDYT